MGIPSYFRGILQKYPGCLLSNLPKKPSALCFDFNCLIYRCLKSPSMPVYSVITEDEWEKQLLEEIEKSVLEIWKISGKPSRVFLAVDGVVPMAKIRQQRVRRFKSAWLRKLSHSGEAWDTNAITPGTRFMECLKQKLNALSKKHIGWIVSGVDEYGEGEHKIMNWLRHLTIDSDPQDLKDIVVYGLDADLILLTMLVGETQNLPMFLLREKQEFGRTMGIDKEKQEYQFMNIREFKEKLGLKTRSDVLNYIGYMSLMGNDFLPHSLTHKLSEDGHDFVLHELRNQREKLIDDDGRVSTLVLKGVFERWSHDEDSRMMHMITKKREQAARGVGKGMSEEDGLPLQWNVEAAFLEGGKLRGGWRDVYWNFLHIQADVDHICQEYLKGVQWIMDYYLGKPVTMSWMFPAWIPPLWSDLARFVSKGVPVDMGEVGVTPSPEEQLAMVLPLESWNLVRSPHLRRLPVELPSMWPRKFGFQSVGRKWLWECEALIPVLTVERLRGASVRDTLNKTI